MSESVTIPTPLEDLHSVTDEMAEKWDKGMKAGKLLAALEGRITKYDPRVTRIRAALEQAATVAARDVLSERRRQMSEEGWTAEHDDKHSLGELGLAAALYAIPYEARTGDVPLIDQDDFIGLHMALEIACDWTIKPEPDRRKRLVKAAALAIAEIDRLDRAEQRVGRTDG